jgi:hypothetical protein
MTNGSHILARGDTHLPFANRASARRAPPCSTPQSVAAAATFAAARMADMDSGMMGTMPLTPTPTTITTCLKATEIAAAINSCN